MEVEKPFSSNIINENFAFIVRIVLNITFIIDLMGACFSIWLILKKSTSEMATYKYFLLNIVIWAILFDFWINVFMTPFELFPAPAICIEGIGKHIVPIIHKRGAMIPAGFLLGGCFASESCAFFYRYFALNANSYEFWTKKKVLLAMGIFHCLPCLPCLGIFYPAVMFYQPTNEIDYIKNNYPFILSIVESRGLTLCGGLAIDLNPLTFWCVGLCAAYFSIILIIAIVLTTYLLHKINQKMKFVHSNNITLINMEMHRQLAVALRIQIFVPAIIMFVPYMTAIPLVFLKLTWMQGIFYVLHFLASLHSFLNTLTMVVLIKPYRRAVMNMIGIKSNLTVPVLRPIVNSSSVQRSSTYRAS